MSKNIRLIAFGLALSLSVSAFAEPLLIAPPPASQEQDAVQKPSHWFWDNWKWAAGITAAGIFCLKPARRASRRAPSRTLQSFRTHDGRTISLPDLGPGGPGGGIFFIGGPGGGSLEGLLAALGGATGTQEHAPIDENAVETLAQPSLLDNRLTFFERQFLLAALEYIRTHDIVAHIQANTLTAEQLIVHLSRLSSILQSGRDAPAALRSQPQDIIIWLPQYERMREEQRSRLVFGQLSPAERTLTAQALEANARGEAPTPEQLAVTSRFIRFPTPSATLPTDLAAFATHFLAQFRDGTSADLHAAHSHQRFRVLHPYHDATDRLSRLLMRLVWAVRNERPVHLRDYAEYREATDNNLTNPDGFAAYLNSKRPR